MISNCGHDENNRYSGGKAGDQSGTEWYIRSWYSSPWYCVLRHPDAQVRELIATLSEEAANNDLIGYDQSERTTFWKHLTQSDYRPSKITIACESDCSSGVAAIVKAAGYILGNSKLKNVSKDCYTGNLRSVLKSAGFKCLTSSKYINSSSCLVRGDILLNDSKHTAINVTTGSGGSYTSSLVNSSGLLRKGSTGSAVKTMQSMLNTCGYSCGSYGADGSFGNDTEKALIKFQKAYKLEADGIYGPASKAKLTEVYNMKSLGDNWVKQLQSAIGASVDGIAGKETLSKCPLLQKGSTGTVVKILQSRLIALGFSCGSYGADGSFGNDTYKAVRAFQKSVKISIDGVVGNDTWSKLLNL